MLSGVFQIGSTVLIYGLFAGPALAIGIGYWAEFRWLAWYYVALMLTYVAVLAATFALAAGDGLSDGGGMDGVIIFTLPGLLLGSFVIAGLFFVTARWLRQRLRP